MRKIKVISKIKINNRIYIVVDVLAVNPQSLVNSICISDTGNKWKIEGEILNSYAGKKEDDNFRTFYFSSDKNDLPEEGEILEISPEPNT